MYRQVVAYCSALSVAKVIRFGLLLALAIELFTMWCRFGLNLEASQHTSLVGAWTFGIRVHHGYLGLLLMLIAWLWAGGNAGLRNLVWMTALGLTLSDLVHQFLILWPIVGSPQFDLFYPQT